MRSIASDRESPRGRGRAAAARGDDPPCSWLASTTTRSPRSRPERRTPARSPGRRAWLAVPRSRDIAIQPASAMIQPLSAWWPITVASTRQRDLVEPAHAEAGHHQVEEHVDARAHLGDAREGLAEERGGRGADAHHRRAHGRRRAGAARRAPRLRARAAPRRGSRPRCATCRSCRRASSRRAELAEAAPIASSSAASGFTPARWSSVSISTSAGSARPSRFGESRQRPRRLDAVEDHAELAARAAQRGHARELAGRDADRVEDVAEAAAKKHSRFLERGDRDGPGAPPSAMARDLMRLRGLHVRAQRHAQRNAAAQSRAQLRSTRARSMTSAGVSRSRSGQGAPVSGACR